MIFDFPVPYTGSMGRSFMKRAEEAIAHVCRIPERILNMIAQLVKVLFFSIAVAFSLSKSEYLNFELKLAAKRFTLNAAGLGTSILGFFAPLHASDWQWRLVVHVFEENFNTREILFKDQEKAYMDRVNSAILAI